jgi:hypothetical protein
VTGIFNLPDYSTRTIMAMGLIPTDKTRPERKADNLTAICQLIYIKRVSFDVSQLCRAPRSVTGLTF